MRLLSLPVCLAVLALAAGLPAAAQRVALPLNDHTRLGQRFTTQQPVAALLVTVPSWSDDEGGLTLSLWDAPARTRLLARRAYTAVRDNQQIEIRPAKPLRPGTYYWEVGDRTGQTRIGLYYDALPADAADCAYVDGMPERRRCFVFEVTAGPPPRSSMPVLIAALRTGSQQQRVEACRQLAQRGAAAAVPALAALLRDPALSHMARYAMESLPDRSVDAALRAALGRLRGRPLVGVINSVAVRRDAGAVGRLVPLLKSADPEVADAAAVALGRIGTPDAAQALVKELAQGRPALYEGCLACADALAASGRRPLAQGLYDRLRSPRAPRAVRAAAARGAILARGPGGLGLLRRMLRSADSDTRGVALWVVQRRMPGRAVTLALASDLGLLPPETRALLVGALARRRDGAALSALTSAASAGPGPVRMAAVRGLAAAGAPAAPALVRLLGDDDADLRQAAQDGLASLPSAEVAAVASSLLRSPTPGSRAAGIALVHRLRLPGFGHGLSGALRDSSSDVRLSALKALQDLAGAEDIAALRDALLGAADAPAAEAAEQALAAACGRSGDPAAVADQLAAGMGRAAPARRAALLRVLGSVGGERALAIVRDAVAGPAGEARSSALEALCAWPTDAAAPDLVRMARSAASPEERLLCLRGALRMAASPDPPPERRLRICQEAAGLVRRDDETRLLLGALGAIPSPEALALVTPHLDNPGTREEAGAAVVGIAAKLVEGPPAAGVVEALERVVQGAGSSGLVERARALLEQARSRT